MFRLFSILSIVFLPGLVMADAEPWIKVDTRRQVLMVMKDSQVLQRFNSISLGHGGATGLRFQGDGRTPTGNFRIAWINPRSKFHLFFGLDYPNMEHARQGYKAGIIDLNTYSKISNAFQQGKTPPQDTLLGGYIGIHGLGDKDPRVHKRLNWTEGCVALTDAQVDQLARWVSVGTRVVIN